MSKGNTDSFVITVPRNSVRSGRQFVAISPETHKKLRDLQDETGIAIGRLVGLAVDYALDHLEIVEED